MRVPERPTLDGLSPSERAKGLYQEALDALDMAGATSNGPERIMLLNLAIQLRRWAREFEEMKDEEG